MGRNKYTAPTDEETVLEELSKGWPQRLNHPLHRQHRLIKSLRPPYKCDSCHTLGKGWSFWCNICDFDLHPGCTLESQLAEMAKPWPRTLDHMLHRDHELVKSRIDSFWCDSCGERGNWWCFYCERCDFTVHLQCALGPRTVHVEKEQPEKLELAIVKSVKESYWCSKCAEEGKGLSYMSEDYFNVNLHPKCITGGNEWPKSTKHELHKEHELVKSQKTGYFCDKCWTEGQGWSFSCNGCNFDLHPRCATEFRTKMAGSEWVDTLMHEQRRHQLMQLIQQQQELQAHAGNEQEKKDESKLRINFMVSGLAGEQQRKQLQDAILQQLQLESNMNQFEQIRLYSEALARIQVDSDQAAADIVAGSSQRRQGQPPYNRLDRNNPFGYC